MENTILLNSDGTFPVDLLGNITGGRLFKRNHTSRKVVQGSGSSLPKLMGNLQLFDNSVIASRGKGFIKPHYQTQEIKKKPIKFII